ncbi:WD40 repeat-like protein [Mycena kentingensis (nom. inval.)]|nr:WD40 repeat-like protein [Mycena kentingensis (nom. inval.)]
MDASESTAASRAADRATLAQIDAEIQAHEQAILSLRLKRKPVEERLQTYTFPTDTIPNEIVSDILIHSIPPYPEPPPFLGPSSPTTLAQVCRRWRQIAHATQALWRSFRFNDQLLIDGKTTTRVELATAKIWLQRSGSLPISFAMWDVFKSPDAQVGALQLLLAHGERWEYVTLHLNTYVNESLGAIGGRFPLLLELETVYEESAIFGLGPFEAPKLRTAYICADHDIAPITQHPEAFWAGLTRLSLFTGSALDVANVLIQTPSLVECRVGLRDSHLSFDDDQLVHLPRLETFILMAANRPAIGFGFAFPNLRAPQLKRCYIDEGVVLEGLVDEQPVERLFDMIEECECELDVLCIARCSRPLDEYRVAFSNVPELLLTDPEEEEDEPQLLIPCVEAWGRWNLFDQHVVSLILK